MYTHTHMQTHKLTLFTIIVTNLSSVSRVVAKDCITSLAACHQRFVRIHNVGIRGFRVVAIVHQ